jgi:hypothetical protein
MKTPHIEKLRADIEADLKAKAFWEAAGRTMRPTILSLQAHWESMFPPESPTSTRRGGNKLSPSPELIVAVCRILDAKMGFEIDDGDFRRAMKTGTPDYFHLMAKAAEYLRAMPREKSVFAKHVISARRIAADMMGKNGPLPTWFEVKDKVSDIMGQFAYGETSRDWGRVRKAAGLADLSD